MSNGDQEIKTGAYVNDDSDTYIVHGVAKGRDTPERLVFYTYSPSTGKESELLYLQVGSFCSAIRGFTHHTALKSDVYGSGLVAAPPGSNVDKLV